MRPSSTGSSTDASQRSIAVAIATDNVGHEEAAPGTPDASTFVEGSSTISNRTLFYNNTFYDDPMNGIGDPGHNTNDDGARSNKVAYLPGTGETTFSNFSGYNKGINGIMVDLSAGGTHASIDVNDFTFRWSQDINGPNGATNDPNGTDGNPAWTAATAPTTRGKITVTMSTSMSVRPSSARPRSRAVQGASLLASPRGGAPSRVWIQPL